MKILPACILLFMALATCSRKSTEPLARFGWRDLASPAKLGESKVPNLFAAADGRIYLSWIEKTGDAPLLFYSWDDRANDNYRRHAAFFALIAA